MVNAPVRNALENGNSFIRLSSGFGAWLRARCEAGAGAARRGDAARLPHCAELKRTPKFQALCNAAFLLDSIPASKGRHDGHQNPDAGRTHAMA